MSSPLALLRGTWEPTPEQAARYAQDEAEAKAQLEARRAEQERRESNPCKKCGGTGHLTHYRHIQGGLCFRCDGYGFEGGGRV